MMYQLTEGQMLYAPIDIYLSEVKGENMSMRCNAELAKMCAVNGIENVTDNLGRAIRVSHP